MSEAPRSCTLAVPYPGCVGQNTPFELRPPQSTGTVAFRIALSCYDDHAAHQCTMQGWPGAGVQAGSSRATSTSCEVLRAPHGLPSAACTGALRAAPCP